MNFNIEADQASLLYKFQSIKIKLYKVKANIKFNKECLKYKIIPKYAEIKI